MRILLAYKAHAEGAADPYTSLLPIGLSYLNAVLAKAGHFASLANFSRSSRREISDLLALQRPDIVGISQFTHNRHESFKLAALAKKSNPSCCVVLGGPHASSRYREILSSHKEVDAIVLGEGEQTMCELAEKISTQGKEALSSVAGLACRLDDKVIQTQARSQVSNLDSLPTPVGYIENSYGVDIRRQLEFIITSRGCPAACRFCSSPRFWQRQVRFRSPSAIVAEIKEIRDRYGLIYFSFRDDTFTVDRNRVIELCKLLLDEKIYILWNCQSRVKSIDDEMLSWMKRAGCECVQLGVESGSPAVLDTLGKRIVPEDAIAAGRAVRRAGINLSIYLISGVPGENDEDLAATLRLVEVIQPHDGQVSPLAYYPGTALFTDAVASCAVRDDLFEITRSAALPVRTDAFSERSINSILSCLNRVAVKSGFTGKDFKDQKRLLGFCHATNLLAGEVYEAQGRTDLAEKEYREIIRTQPANPWGWLALGELCGEMGKGKEAAEAFSEVCKLLPTHAPAYTALGELSRLRKDSAAACDYYRKALEIDPFDETARHWLHHGLQAKK